jgi:glucokinase
MKTDALVLGVDIGGSHITASLVDLNRRTILPESLQRHHVDSAGSAESIISEWCHALRHVIDNNNLTDPRIGIAMPGPFDYEQGISFIKGLAKYETLYGLNVKKLISDHLSVPIENIRLKNDAGCFLQGEAFAGAAQGYEHAIGITLGTGIGTARYHDGSAEDADLWKLPFRNSFAEEFISTRWFIGRYAELTGKTVKDVKALVAMFNTDKVVPLLFDEFADALAAFLAEFVAMDNPQVIVAGGNIVHASDYFFPRLIKNLQGNNITIPVKKAMLGEHAAMLGAAQLVGQPMSGFINF